jgi:hypothetical protein
MKRLVFFLTLLGCFVLTYFDAFAAVPTVQAKYLAFSSLTSTSVTVYWTRGNGTNRIVVIRTDNNWTATDAALTDNGSTYSDANGNRSTAPQVGTTGSYVIDVMGPAGTPNYLRSTNLTNLTAGTTYYVKVYEFNVDGSYWDYYNASDVNNPRSFTTSGAYSGSLPGGLGISPWSEGGQLSWTSDGTGAVGYLLSVYNNTSSSWAFQNRDIGKPSDMKYQVFGLNANQSYTYYLYAYDASGNVSSSSSSVTQTTLTNPGISSASYTPSHGSAPYYNNVGIGCNIVVTVTATNGQLGLLPNGAQTINGINVTSTFTDNRNGTYTLTYTVASGHTDINDNGTDLPLSFNFQDGNSVAFASSYSPANNLSAPGVDQTRPYVTSIVRQSPATQCTNANSVVFRVTFNEAVATSSVTTSDFAITNVSGPSGTASISSISAVSPVGAGATQYDVTVNVTGIDREIRLDFTGAVNDMAYGCPNGSTTTYSSGQTYYIDHTNPSVTITLPVNASCYRSATLPGNISGTATDAWVPGAPCPISSVDVAIWRDVNSNGTFDVGTDGYWNGTAWTGTSPTWFAATLALPNWSIAMFSLPSDARYYLQTRVTDGAGNQSILGQTAYYFIYDNTPPSGGSISNPAAGVCWNSGNHTINWTSATDANLSSTVAIQYSSNNGGTWNTVVVSTSNSGTYTWNIPSGINSPTNQGYIRIVFSDCAGNTYNLSSSAFTFDDTPPTNTSTPTLSSSCLLTGGSATITWTPGNISDANSYTLTLQYSTNSGSTWTNIATGEANDGSYTWNPLPSTAICSNNGRVRIIAVDCAGNQATGNNSAGFTIDDLNITAQPQNKIICSNPGSAIFTVTASSTCGSVTYQWQYSPDNATWSNVTNGTPTNATYSGGTTNQLTVTSSGITPGTYYYRCIVTAGCGSANVTSSSAQLQVVSPLNFGATYPTNPSPQIIGNPITLTFNYTGGTSNVTYKLYKYSDNSCSTGQTLITSGNVTSNPYTISYGTVDCSTAGYYKIVIEDDCPSTVNGPCFEIQALAPEPTTQASGISGGRTRTTISLIWTSGNGMGRLVAATYNSTSYTGQIPVDGVTYTGANAYWPSASWFTSSPTKLLYNGTGSSAYITGLSPSTWYTFMIFEYNYDNGCASTSTNYNTSTVSNNPRAIRTTAKEVGDEEVVRVENFGITPIWPNPVESVLQFDLLAGKAANFKVEIVGMDGRTLFAHEYTYDGATTVMIELDKRIFAPGAYMLRVSALGETLQQMFIFMP